jgi:excisionase family DNA binding protein
MDPWKRRFSSETQIALGATAQPVRFFTVANVAESLSVSTRTVRRWIDAGELIAHRFNGVLRICDADLQAFLARHREG